MTRTVLRDLFAHKEWLRKNIPHNFLGKLYHAVLTKLYFNRMEAAGSMIGVNANFLTSPVLPHGISGIFISSASKIGKNSIILQQVTIGVADWKKSENIQAPVIGDNVLIGAGAKILGGVTVGDNCRIGANAVVTADIPPNSIVKVQNQVIVKESLDNRYYVRKKYGWWVYEDGILVKCSDEPQTDSLI